MSIACASAAMVGVGPAWSHHSTALFDYTKTTTLKGTVKAFRWTNPHSFIQVLVKDARGVEQEWSIECGTPTVMSRMGWRKNSINPGDKVTLSIAPIRDGANGGTLRLAVLADGTQLAGVANSIKADASGKPSGLELPTLPRATPRQ